MYISQGDLRQIWLDLYLHAVKSSNCITPAIVHEHARETADAYIALVRADMDARDKDAAERAREAADNGKALILPPALTAETRDVVAFLRAAAAKWEATAQATSSGISFDRCSVRVETLRIVADHIECGDHIGAADREAVKP